MSTPTELLLKGFKLFPIAPGAKAPPLVTDWPKHATNDLALVERWAKANPGCNWGIHCEGLLVLDVDTKSGGKESLRALKKEHDLSPTLAARTPSGGYHLFYREDSVPNSASLVAPGIDVRSTNGYVVAPGSELPSGKYRWVNNEPIAPSPEWLREKATSKREAQVLETAPDEVDQEVARREVAEYLKRTEAPMAGERDARMVAIAAQVKDLGLNLPEGLELITQWAVSRGLDFTDFPVAQLEKCVRQGYKTENAAGSKSVEAMAELFEDLKGEPKEVKLELDELLYRPIDVDAASVFKNQYIVKGWIDRGIHALAFGRWGAGKTFVTLDMCAHVASGRRWFGQRVRQGPVLYLGYEGAIAMRKRLLALRQKYDWDWDRLPFFLRDMEAPLVLPNGTQDVKPAGAYILEKSVATIKGAIGETPVLIVVDPLRDALGGSDSDVDYTQPYIRYTKQLVKAYECTVLTIHHPGHSESTRARGDSGIEASASSVIMVDGEAGKITSTKQRDSVKADLYYSLDVKELGRDEDGDTITTCTVSHTSSAPGNADLNERQNAVLKVLANNADEEGLVKDSVLAQDRDIVASKDAIQDIIKVLVAKGYLKIKDQSARTTTYSVQPNPVADTFEGHHG